MNIKQAFPSNYIAAEDLQGQDVPVQIAGCRMEPVKQDNGADKDKPVLYFAGHQRGLVLNVTNGLAFASLYGEETDAWRGRSITLYPTQCQFGNRMVDCVRVRPFAPRQENGQPPQPFGQPQPRPYLPPQPPPPPAGQLFSTPPMPPQTSEQPQQQQPFQQPPAGSPVQF